MHYLILIACCLFLSPSWAQHTAVITGSIYNAVWKEVSIEIDRTYLDNTYVTETTVLNDQNKFSFELEINIPQMVVLEYANNRHSLYIEPGADLTVGFDANSFKYSMVFGGQCGRNNDFMRSYQIQFPEETNRFRMRQLKKGIVYYDTDEALETKMRKLGPVSFKDDMRILRERKENYLTQYELREGLFTDMFAKYMRAEIRYDWAYKMMMYGYSFQVLHNIDESFFRFVEEVTLRNDDVLGNEKYRKFLVGYINMAYDKSNKGGNPYIGQYYLAPQLVSDISLSFFQADILARGFKKNELAEMLPIYNEFVATVPYNEFYLRAVDAYFQKKQYAIGTPAPNFTLKNVGGEEVSLYDVQGKIVVINFWASWCRPCLNKIDIAKYVKERMDSTEIVFLNISLERAQEGFVYEVGNRKLENMINLFAENGLKSEVTTSYDVKAIPEFFIISKAGTFARKPKKTDAYSLETHLKSMIN